MAEAPFPPNLEVISPLVYPNIFCRPTAFLRQTPDPFVSRLFTGLERRQAPVLDDLWLDMTWMGMESHHHVADDITPSQIFSTWNGLEDFDPNTAGRHPASYPPQVRARCLSRIGAPRQLYKLAWNVNEDGVGEG